MAAYWPRNMLMAMPLEGYENPYRSRPPPRAADLVRLPRFWLPPQAGQPEENSEETEESSQEEAETAAVAEPAPTAVEESAQEQSQEQTQECPKTPVGGRASAVAMEETPKTATAKRTQPKKIVAEKQTKKPCSVKAPQKTVTKKPQKCLKKPARRGGSGSGSGASAAPKTPVKAPKSKTFTKVVKARVKASPKSKTVAKVVKARVKAS